MFSHGWEAERGGDLPFLTRRHVSHPTGYFRSPVLTPLTVTKSKSHQTPPLGGGANVITAAIKTADLTASVQFSRLLSPPRSTSACHDAPLLSSTLLAACDSPPLFLTLRAARRADGSWWNGEGGAKVKWLYCSGDYLPHLPLLPSPQGLVRERGLSS